MPNYVISITSDLLEHHTTSVLGFSDFRDQIRRKWKESQSQKSPARGPPNPQHQRGTLLTAEGRGRSPQDGHQPGGFMTKTSAETPSKWNPSQYISTSEDEEKGTSADSVGRRVKFTRGKNTKDLAKATASALSEFKIPKKEKQCIKISTNYI